MYEQFVGPNGPQFDSNAYWLKRGPGYMDEPHLKRNADYFRGQEKLVVDTVGEFAPKLILELGCGFGRITRCLLIPDRLVLGLDLSSEQIHNAEQYCEEYRGKVQFMPADVMQITRFPKFDLCLSIEMFLHLEIAKLKVLIPRILDACPVLIHDFDVNPVDFVSPHVHAHDYDALYRELGLQCETRIFGPYGLKIVRAR